MPITARGVADFVVTDLGVFRLMDGVLTLTELLGDTELEDVAAAVSAAYEIALEARV